MSTQISQTYVFLPPRIGSCYVWLDASVSSNFTFSSGSNISSWIDRSGNGYTATAVNNPTHDSVNMRVRFNSASSQFMSNTSAPLNLRQRSFFFVVEELTSAAVSGIMPIIPNPTSGADYTTTNGITIEENNGIYFYQNGGGYAMRVSNTVPLPKGIYSEVFSSPNGSGYLNGTANGTGTANFTPGTSAGYGLGGRWNNGVAAPYINAYYYEVLVYSKAVSTTERQQVEGYLAWKWGLQGSLPASHPYKSFPPFANQYTLPVAITTPQSILRNALFAPTQISGCQLWLDASDPTTVSLTGTTVSQWRDKSGQGNTAIPTGTISYTANINGLTAMSYPGTFSTYFKGSLTNTGATLTAFSVFVCNSSSYSVVRILSLAKDGANDFNNTLYVAAMQRQTNNFISYRNNATLGLVAATLDTPSLFTTQFTGSSNTVYWNGAAGSTAASSGNFGYTNYEVGTSYGEENLVNLNGSVGEVVVYHASLTTAQRQQVEGYLAWKWGLQSLLPSTHPYKNSPFTNVPAAPTPPYPPQISSTVWLPTRISGLSLWLDAADKTTIVGATVTLWQDKSGSGNTATSPAGPTQSSYSGYPVLSFNGTSQYMNSPSTVPTTSHSFFVVYRPSSSAGNTSLIRYQTTGVNYIVFPYLNGSTPRGYITSYDGVTIDFNNSTLLENSVTTALNLVSIVITSGSQAVYRNGAVQATTAVALASATSPSLVIGRYQPSNAEFFGGDLGEVVIYPSTLSGFEREQVEGYLAWKWGLQTSLSDSHRYRFWPPPP